MKCLKCGAYVYQSDKFCRSCGTTLNSDTCQYGDNIPNSSYDSSSCHETQYNYSYQYSNKTEPTYDMNATHAEQYDYNTNYSYDPSKYDYAYQPNDSGGDKFVKAYIGRNYNQINNMKFSIPALIFGPLYLLYRKVWGYAFGAILISIAASLLLDSGYADIVNLIIHVFFAFKFKEIYLRQAEDKVENIEQQSLDKSTEELLNICRKKGGTSIKALFTIFFVTIILAFCLSAYYGVTDNSSSSLPEEETTYLYTTKLGDLYYKLPTGYSQTYSYSDSQRYEKTNCSITVEKRIPYGFYSDAESYLNSLTTPSSGINTINYNEHIWKYKQISNSSNYKNIYAYKHNDTLYLITLGNTNYYSCNKSYDQILPTLKFYN